MAENELNEMRAERLAHIANPLALVAQQQPVYHPQTHPIHYTQSSSTRSQAATRNRGKPIVNNPQPSYLSEPEVVADDESSSKENEIYKLMALISMSFKKIYKPTNNNLRTSSNIKNTNVDNTPRTNRRTWHVARECQKPKRARDSAYDKEKMLFYKQEVHNSNDDYNVFANERQHHEQPESVNDTYLAKQGDTNITHDS
ncbi:hypothetical protein Tco_0364723 [Tanacetum coccineum]